MLYRKYIVVIEDTPLDTQFVEYFSKFNFDVVQKPNFTNLDISSQSPAALLIDLPIILADLTALNTFYSLYSVPIIIMSDKSNEEACVHLLEAGADDFLIKPIHPRELHARINAITRRVQSIIAHGDTEKEAILFNDWRLCPTSRRLFNEQNEEMVLSTSEYDLLLTFVRHAQQVLSREALLQAEKNHNPFSPFDRRIDVQISRLRQKLELDAKKPMLIKTIRNQGYLFTAQVRLLKE